MRLLTSVLFAAAACTFVVGYDRMSQIRYRIDHPTAEGYWASPGEFVLENQTDGGKFITAYRGYAYAVPLAGLLLGILVIWRWPRFPALAELVVSVMWFVGLVWAGFVLLMWQTQNVPVFYGMRSHF